MPLAFFDYLDIIDIGQKIFLPTLNVEIFIIEIAKNIFSIHIASFNSYTHAKYYLTKLKSLEYPLFLFPVKIAGTTPWYRITLGGFNTRQKAFEVAKSMKSDLVAFK